MAEKKKYKVARAIIRRKIYKERWVIAFDPDLAAQYVRNGSLNFYDGSEPAINTEDKPPEGITFKKYKVARQIAITIEIWKERSELELDPDIAAPYLRDGSLNEYVERPPRTGAICSG